MKSEDPLKLPKIAYCLAAKNDSPFIDWALINMALVKQQNKSFVAVVCTDDPTFEILLKNNHELVNIADEIHTIKPFKGTIRERSRWIKINLREMIEGDFVYFDCDAIPISSFSELYKHSFDMAAIDIFGFAKGLDEWFIPSCKTLDWSYLPNKHYSGGLFFMKDNYNSRTFYELWKEKWLIWRKFDKSGVSADQPAFNSAIAESEINVLELPLKFNIPLLRPNVMVEDPRIFHYPASIRRMTYSSLLSKLSRQFHKSRKVNHILVEKAIESKNPWVLPIYFVWIEYFFNGLAQTIIRKLRDLMPLNVKRKMVR